MYKHLCNLICPTYVPGVLSGRIILYVFDHNSQRAWDSGNNGGFGPCGLDFERNFW